MSPEPQYDAYQVRQLVPGFPYRHYGEDDDGELILYSPGSIDLTLTRPAEAFRLIDPANEIYLKPSASAAEWEQAEPRGILTPWQELEDKLARGEYTPVVVRAENDGTFTILDGHHRISMSRHLGITQLPALIDWNGIDRPQLGRLGSQAAPATPSADPQLEI